MPRPRVYVTRPIFQEAISLLEAVAETVVWPGDLPPPYEALAREASQADGLFCLLTDRVDAALLEASPRLKVVSNMAVGYNNIDVAAATRHGVYVGNTPGVLTETTADFAFALLMAWARRVPQSQAFVHEGRWRTWEPMAFLDADVHGATLGIVGLGRIGAAVARRARGFDMRVLYHGRTRKPDLEADLGVTFVPGLADLLAQSDYVTLHVPLSAGTRGLIGARELQAMKPSALLVNTARGDVVDQGALYNALKAGTIAGAALDVWRWPGVGRSAGGQLGTPKAATTLVCPSPIYWEVRRRERSMPARPRIAITMGDAAGVGPEVIVKALADPRVYGLCAPVVIGVTWAIDEAIALTKAPMSSRSVTGPQEAQGEGGVIDVMDMGNLSSGDVTVGEVSAACGKAAVEYIEAAARLAAAGEVNAMVTAPINKAAVRAAGFHGDIGHQEILARMTGAPLTATMLMTNGLRVAHLSTHKSLIEAARYVKKDIVLAKLRLTAEGLVRWGLDRPRIAVAALNPHGGEGGLLGREEIEEIGPAVEAARSEGIDARGPFPADSVFYRAIDGEFDAVFALYHDQGHIAVKVHDFEDSVTVNLGLPFVRTSVDHGTAFDIAGKGIANHVGMVRAIETAVTLTTSSLGASAAA